MIEQRYAEPQAFYALAGRFVPWFVAAALALAVPGLYLAFFSAPTDPRQGEVFRIAFVHVPAAWMSVFLYLVMASWAAAGLALNLRIAFVMTHALAPTGALFSFLALWTGTIWGKPTLGAWWVGDARLTAELVFLLVYLGIMVLGAAISELRWADRACALLALVGALNVPVIYYTAPNLSGKVFAGTLVMAAALWMYSIATALARARCILLEREQESPWVCAALSEPSRAPLAEPREARPA